jgi:hypothetical protein
MDENHVSRGYWAAQVASTPNSAFLLKHGLIKIGFLRSSLLRILTAALSTLLPFAAAQAVTYSAAAGYYHTVGGSVPGTYTTSEAGGLASATVSPATGGTINVSATSLGAPDNYNGMTAYGLIRYDIQLFGLPDISVPVRVQAYGYAQGAGFGYQGNTSFQMTGQSLGTVGGHAETSIENPFASFSFDQTIILDSNTDYNVQLFANVSAVFRNGGGTALAFVDPVFTVDPSYADRFSIVGAPGQAGAVPEPAAWALMALGFGLAGAVMRRPKRRLCIIQTRIHGR